MTVEETGEVVRIVVADPLRDFLNTEVAIAEQVLRLAQAQADDILERRRSKEPPELGAEVRDGQVHTLGQVSNRNRLVVVRLDIRS